MAPSKQKPDMLRGPYPWIAVFAALFALHLTAASSEIGGNIGGDAVVYFLLGKALATGQGYVDLYLAGTPAHTQYPFIFPLLLAPFNLIFKQPLFWMHAMVCAFNAAAAVFLGMWAMERRKSDSAGLVFAGLFGTIPVVYLQSLHLLTEPVYMAFFSLMLFLLARPVDKDPPPMRLLAVILAALAAYFTRSAGVAAVAAAAGVLFIAKRSTVIRGRRVPAWAAVLGAFAVCAGAWYLRNTLVAGNATPYSGQFWAVNPLRPEEGKMGLGDFIDRVVFNFRFYGSMFGGLAIGPLAIKSYTNLEAIFLIPLAAGLVKGLWKGTREAEIFYLVSVVIVILWPFNEARFVVPIIPLGFFFTVEGIEWGVEKIAGRERTGRIMLGLLAVFVAGQAVVVGIHVRDRFIHHPEPRKPVEVKGFGEWSKPVMDYANYDIKYDPNDPDTFEAVDIFTKYLVINSVAGQIIPPGSIVISRKPMWTYFLSGRRSVPVLHDNDPIHQWKYYLDNKADYIIVGLEERAAYPAINEAIKKQDGSMRIEAMVGQFGASVIKIDRTLAPKAAREKQP